MLLLLLRLLVVSMTHGVVHVALVFIVTVRVVMQHIV
jgi:hypothetical protein